jgi:hypothetical protein
MKGKFIGKWATCYQVDSIDYLCSDTTQQFELKANGKYIGSDIIIGGIRDLVSGSWKFENNTLTIVIDNTVDYSFPPRSYADINFINDNLFYYKIIGAKEVPGHYIYFSFKRIK